MKRLFAIGLSLLMLVGFPADAVAMSDCDKQIFVDVVEKYDAYSGFILLEAPNGCWDWVGITSNLYQRKKSAPRECYEKCKQRCEIKFYADREKAKDHPYIASRGLCGSSGSGQASGSTQSDYRKIRDGLAALKEAWGLPTASTSLTYTDGSKYEGNVSNGVPHGRGTYTWADGSMYEGEFKGGQAHGLGTMVSANGNVYIGEFKNNGMHGVGTFNWIDGRKYFGDWKVGKMHGHGTYTWPNGKTFVGEAKDDKPWNVVQYSASGVVEGTYSNGKWCAGCKPTAKQLETPSTTTSSNSDAALELEYWNVVKNSNDVDLLQAYLDEYPNGKFAPLVKIKVKKLKSSSGDN